MKILIVEDELLIQKSLKKLLEKKGAQVTATAQGKEAIELIKNEHFDRIVCDLMLQDITGFDVIEESRVRFSPEEIASKFVIMTAYGSMQVLEKASKYGCKLFNKPFENLEATIQSFLSIE